MTDNVPEKNEKDRLHALAKLGLNAIPWVGGPLAELFNEIITPSIEKRRDEFFRELNARLQKLEEKKFLDLNELKNSEELVDVVIKAMKSAISTREKEKREALLNAILNTSLGKSPKENLADIFINWIDSFTEYHIKILNLFNEPDKHVSANPPGFGSISNFIELTFSELEGRRDFYEQLWRDLYSRGLLSIPVEQLHTTMTGQGIMEKRTTSIGKTFIKFISSPDKL